MEHNDKLSFHFGRFGQYIPLITALIFIVIAATHESNISGYSIAFFAAIIIGCLAAKNPAAYGEAAVNGLSSHIFGTISVAIIFAAIAGRLVSASGLIETLAHLLLQLKVSGGGVCAISFLLCCLFSMATGTSVGTYMVTMPILFPIGVFVGVPPALMIGAIVSGGLFGDNLAPISDTTIASATTQEAEMGGVVKTRCWYSLPVAICCFLVFFLLGGPALQTDVAMTPAVNTKSLFLIAVPLVIMILCILKMNLLVSLSIGILTGCLIGLLSGVYPFHSLFSYPGSFQVGGLFIEAITGTAPTLFMLIGAFLLLGVIEKTEITESLVHGMTRLSKGRKSAELSIVLSVGLLGAITGVSTVSIIALGHAVQKVGQQYGINKYRRANLMDCGGLSITSLAPWTVHVVYPITLASVSNPELVISPFEVVTHNFYGLFMVAMILFAVVSGFGAKKEPEGK